MKRQKKILPKSEDPFDILKGRSVFDLSDDELYELIDPTKQRSFYTSQFSLIVAEILRRTRKK